jgi:signal transduction histidine kinase
MDDRQPARLPVAAPDVPPPPPFVERRVHYRRESTRVAHEERLLLARALDVLASDEPPEQRLAGLLDLLAQTVRAERAAVVADGAARRVAVAASGPGDHDAAMALGTWLDAAAPRSRARRAAARRAPISVALRAGPEVAPDPARGPAADPVAGPHARSDAPTLGLEPAPADVAQSDLTFACLPIPSGEVTLGFSFRRSADAGALATRLPPGLARHAAVALALVTDALATERELAGLRAADAERALFVSTVAHELRTPLTSLSGYLELILDGRVEDAAVEHEFLERGRTIVGSMAALVDDLLELSRLESGTLALSQGPFSVADALNAVAAGLMPIALDRGARLHVTAPPRLRAATGDRRRVEQIVTNLAANAIKFAGHRPVELVGLFEGAVAVIAVRDEGPGIAETDRERIFERFYRMADHDPITGTGLGLPIARDLARAMGGELDVASVLGTGSSFVLVMPGPAGPIPKAAMVEATRAALALESDRLRTRALLRAAAATDGTRTADGRTGLRDDEDGPTATGDSDGSRPGRHDQLPANVLR